MRISEQSGPVLTRDLLARAARSRNGDEQSLRFRALHLNLPVVTEVADRLALTPAQRQRTEHAAIDGLHEAIMHFDPFGETDFTDFAAPLVERRVRAELAAGPSACEHLDQRVVERR